MTLKSDRELKLVSAALRHKKLMYVTIIILIAIGLIGLVRMNRDEFPSFDIKMGLVAAVYPGASAEEVKSQVTEPLEKVLFSIPEVNRQTLSSFSKDGICYMYVDLNSPASTKDQVWSKIKLRLNSAKLTLPAGVAAVVAIDNFSETSSLLIAMESDDKGYSEMLGYAETLCERLRSLKKLSNASIIGDQEEEIAVNLDLDRLSTYGINPSLLMLEYQTTSLNVSGGHFRTDYSNAPIHIGSPVTTEQEVEERTVYSDPAGYTLRLKDIAKVERRYARPAPYVTYNGHTAIIVNVTMSKDNNIVTFGKEVDKVLAEFSDDLPDSVKMSRITDQPKIVKNSVFSFVRDLFISMLVVIFVMLMLFPMRSALIAGSGVPVCTAVTLALMYAIGMQLNTVTLAALIVVLGMIVDDSIITMDGYMANLNKGMSRRDAALASSRELFLPMFMATFALSAMFFPTQVIITGYLGDFIRSFPWIIAMALGCSLVYAMLVVPSLEIRFISHAQEKPNLLGRMQNGFFAFMQRIYDKGEAFCFRHPAGTVLVGVTAIVLGVLMFSRINVQMLPKVTRDCFAVEVFLDDNSSLDETSAVSDSLTKILLSDKRIASVTAFIGESAPRFHCTYSPALPGDNVAQLIVNTVSNDATVQVLKDMESRYEHWFPNALIHFKQMDYQAEGAIAVTLKGAPVDVLKPYSDSLRNFMYGMDDMLKWVHSDCDDYMAGVEVNIDQDEASRLGVNRTMMAMAMGGTLEGYPIATIYEGRHKLPVRIYCDNYSGDSDYNDLGSMLVPSAKPGVSVPLSQVATITPGWSYPQLPRFGGEDCITVYADMRTGYSQPEAMKKIDKYINDRIKPDMPEGTSIRYGGLSSSNEYVFPQIAWSFLAAVTVLFIFLLVHFKKASIACLTMVLSLLCLFGASFGLWAFGMDFTITAVLGLISLVGIIVRNGIIMFEYAEELRFTNGMSVREAAMLAGQRRMRPIFLTSCTTALGVLPMILSGDLLWMPMGLVIAFGTMLSIIFIVLIMPVSYWLLFRRADTQNNSTVSK